jgi:hypothetical protein
MVMCGLTLVMMTFQSLVPKNFAYVYMIIMSIISYLAFTPLGTMIFPPIADLAVWIQMYPSAVGVQMLWTGLYMGAMIVMIRVILFKETLRPM